MDEYNIEEYRAYLNAQDYLGAAKYLDAHPASTLKGQVELDKEISRLTRLGNKHQAITSQLKQMGSNTLNSYNLVNSINDSTIPLESSPLGKEYIDLVNNLKTKYNTPISKIQFVCKDKDAYDNFLNRAGITDSVNAVNLPFDVNFLEDGGYAINVSTNDRKLVDYLNINKDFEWSDVTKFGTFIGSGFQAITGNAFAPSIKSAIAVNNALNRYPNLTGYDINAIDANGNVISGDDFDTSSLRKLRNLVNDARERNDTAFEQLGTLATTETLLTSSFLGQGHVNLEEDYKNNIINDATYNHAFKRIKESYDNAIHLHSFTQYEVYSTDEKNSNVHNVKLLESSEEKAKLQTLVTTAMKENRVRYQSGILGDKIGTVIVVDAKLDSHSDLEKGDFAGERRIFIPEFFGDNAQAAFESDTKGQAVLDHNDMKRWGYAKQLHDGSHIGYKNGLGTYKKDYDENGQPRITPISDAIALSLLEENHIIDQTAKEIRNHMRYEENPSIYHHPNGKVTPYNPLAMIDLISDLIIQEHYPRSLYSFSDQQQRKLEIGILINNVLKGYGINITEDQTN